MTRQFNQAYQIEEFNQLAMDLTSLKTEVDRSRNYSYHEKLNSEDKIEKDKGNRNSMLYIKEKHTGLL